MMNSSYIDEGLTAESPVMDAALKLHHRWAFQSDREFLVKKLGQEKSFSSFSPVRNSPTRNLIKSCDQNYIRRQKFVRSYTFNMDKVNACDRTKKWWLKVKENLLKLKNNAEHSCLSS